MSLLTLVMSYRSRDFHEIISNFSSSDPVGGGFISDRGSVSSASQRPPACRFRCASSFDRPVPENLVIGTIGIRYFGRQSAITSRPSDPAGGSQSDRASIGLGRSNAVPELCAVDDSESTNRFFAKYPHFAKIAVAREAAAASPGGRFRRRGEE